MAKLALVVNRTDLHEVETFVPLQYDPENPRNDGATGLSNGFFSLPTKIMDRAVCETDHTVLQIIPYITLFDIDTSEIFIYTRGKSGNEGRLHGKCSIGLGGHIEDQPDEDRSLLSVIVDCAARELEEETGICLTHEERLELGIQMFDSPTGIYDDSDEVGSVHFGIWIGIKVDRSRIVEFEEGVISKGEWLPLKNIAGRVTNNDIELEKWSDMMLQQFIWANVSESNRFKRYLTPLKVMA